MLEEYRQTGSTTNMPISNDILTSLEEAISYPDKHRDERMSMKLKYLGEEGHGASKRVLKIMMTKDE